MAEPSFTTERGDDGVLIVTWDMPGRSMNVITPDAMAELAEIVERVAADQDIKGAVIRSGKAGFSGGADLTMLEGIGRAAAKEAAGNGPEAAAQLVLAESRRLSQLYRRLETCGKPFAVAIHGVCLGGAFELALACHHRIASDSPSTRVGLPEVKVGLFPGAGGTQRVARMMPAGDALQLLTKGDQISADRAKTMRLVDDVMPAERMVDAARVWIANGGPATKPWDQDGFRLPGGPVWSKTGFMTWPPANAIYRRETYDNYPAIRAVLKTVFDGLQLPMDLALAVESRHFAKILQSKEAAAMIRTLFVSMQELNKGARRPAAVPPATPKRVGVVGAGFMGAGIAYVTAQAGIDVVLVDKDQPSAERGRDFAHKLISGRILKGRAKAADREALMTRIEATADVSRLAGCDLVIEAVFEDPGVKAGVIAQVEAAIGPDAVFGSNTSTLPISGLAQASARPERFIGIHFFSPVEKMMLVEIIMGKETGEAALAMALDYVRAIRKTPVVVNDSRGFYANRCVGAYLLEGHAMLAEGVPPAMIENVARMAGMPVGPLALNDEVALDLALRIVAATEAQVGPDAVDPRQKALLAAMVETHGRLGRKNGKGFYDYPETGRKRLWPGLSDLQQARLDPDTLDVAELKHRFLVAQALEAARTVAEGVVTDPREADVGAILGFGFAPFTGGPLSWIDGMGVARFVALAENLATRHGARFDPPALLREMAQRGETFYGRFGHGAPARAA